MKSDLLNEKKNKLLSVVLPTYGVEAYLQACLESILETECLLEVVVVIDASPDRSLQIARQFEQHDSRVKVVINETNQGLGASRNIGFRASNGKYVLFADSDDVVVPQTLQKMVSSLESSNSDFATAPADEFGRTKGRKRYWTTTAPIFREGIQKTDIVEHPELVSDHTAWTKVFRSSFIQNEDIEWSEKVKCEDVYASMRAYARAKSIDVIPEISYLYRRRPGSITTNLTSSSTLGDWARQSLLGLAQIPDGSQAKQFVVAKMLETEIPSRIQASEVVMEPEDEKSFEQCIAQVLNLADEKTLQNARRENLERLANYTPKDRDFRIQVENLKKFIGGDQLSTFENVNSRDLETSTEASPILSVVMPTYNVSYWVDEAIRSILAQNFKDLELIIIDDSSSDETWEKIQRWVKKDARVQAFLNPGNGGAQARNFGISMASGKYLAFADGDDLIPKNAYQQMVFTMESSGSEMAVGDFQKFWPSSTWKNSEAFGLDELKRGVRLEEHPKLIGNRTCWNRLFRRDFWNKNAIHFPSTPRANDILPMTLAMRVAETIDVVPSIVYHYRARSGSGSMTSKVATASSVIGYFRQESLCAALIGISASRPLQSDYWRTAVAIDGWGNLSNFLKTVDTSNSEKSEQGVALAVNALWSNAPELVRRILGPYKVLTYELVSQNDIQQAAYLCVAEHNRHKSPNLAPEILSAICRIKNKEEYVDEILQVYRGTILRALLDDSSPWNVPMVEKIMDLSQKLAKEVNLQELVVPDSRETRLLAAILSGQENAVWRECRDKHLQITLKTVLSASNGRELRIDLEAENSQQISFLELTTGNKKSASYVSIPLFVQESSVQIRNSLFSTLRGHSWQIKAVFDDDFGKRTIPIVLESKLPESKLSSVRIRKNELRILLKGPDRIRRAADWRVEKLKKLLTKGLKK